MIADHEFNNDILEEPPNNQPNAKEDDDIKTKVEKVGTYTICKEILILRAQGLKKQLETNNLGQPIGSL